MGEEEDEEEKKENEEKEKEEKKEKEEEEKKEKEEKEKKEKEEKEKKEKEKKEKEEKEKKEKEEPPKPAAAPAASKPKKKDLAEFSEKNYNFELLKQIEELRERRDDLTLKISKDMEEKARLLGDIKGKNNRLDAIESSIEKRKNMRNEIDEDISMVEEELFKILESSANLLKTLKNKRKD